MKQIELASKVLQLELAKKTLESELKAVKAELIKAHTSNGLLVSKVHELTSGTVHVFERAQWEQRLLSEFANQEIRALAQVLKVSKASAVKAEEVDLRVNISDSFYIEKHIPVIKVTG